MEYWILGVDHRPDGAIESVCAASVDRMKCESNGEFSMGVVEVVPREQVLTWLRSGHSVFTATRVDINLWKGGEEVIIHHDPRYITTKANSRECDNLGQLPPCSELLPTVRTHPLS